MEGEAERPRAVSEYLVERMILGGAQRICFVIAPGKSDILEYYGNRPNKAHISFTVQRVPAGLCDAVFQALPLIPADEFVIVGLPDTIWFPEDALKMLGDDPGQVREIRVKQQNPGSPWIWGAFKLSGHTMRELYDLWCERQQADEYIGTLINAYLARGGAAVGVRAGEAYVDVGTLHGYREAIRLLSSRPVAPVGATA
jgi:dTDP-glucose pyrophosphorylase